MQAIASDLVLPEFEGPLDLLLHLVKKHELDIFNIPISFITEKYLQALLYLQALNMDIAGEYLLMAATLLYLKSRELLPPEAQPPSEEAQAEDEMGDPREALIKRLLEYQRFKTAAAELLMRPVMGRNVWARGIPAQAAAAGDVISEAPLAEVPVWELIELLAKVLGRTRRRLTHEVTVERLSLADRINELAERLDRVHRAEFSQLLVELAERTADSLSGFGSQIVLTFMAMLEMARLKLLTIYQAKEQGSIYIARVGSNPIAPSVSPNPQVELPLPDPNTAEHLAPPAVEATEAAEAVEVTEAVAVIEAADAVAVTETAAAIEVAEATEAAAVIDAPETAGAVEGTQVIDDAEPPAAPEPPNESDPEPQEPSFEP